MKDIKIISFENIKDKLLSFILAAVLVISVIYVFELSYLNSYSAISVFLVAVFFLLYDFVAKHKHIGSIVYMVATGLVLYLVYLILTNQSVDRTTAMVSFVEWFFSGAQAVKTETYHMQTIVLGFAFFFSSVVYYFINVSYRVLMIMVICLIPFALYVKVSAAPPTAFAFLIAALNIFLYLKNSRKEIAQKAKVVGGYSIIGNYSDFAVAAVLLAFILPKPSETPYYEKFEDFANRFTIGGIYNKNSGKYTKTSGNADDFLNMENILLYIVNTNFPEYFKVQVFENYDSVNHYWTINNDSVQGNASWETDQQNLDYSKLLDAYKKAVELSPEIEEKYNLTKLLSLDATEQLRKSNVRSINYNSEYIISTVRTGQIVFPEESRVKRIYRSVNGEIFPDVDILSSTETYDVYYYQNSFIQNSGWIDAGGCDLTFEQYGNLLSDISTVLSENNIDDYDCVKTFVHEYIEVMNYYTINNDTFISDEIIMLANEITDGLTYDWEKAKAIENYFINENFIYDLAYRAPKNNDTPEFFIFESKRGTCSDFATAYCLLARAAGLTIRYVEGFVPNLINGNNGVYEINTENAHAYPEVFISGAGWTVYEPTVADLSSVSSQNAANVAANDRLTNIVTIITVTIIIIFVVILILLMPAFIECLFRLSVRLMKNKKAVITLYNKHCFNIKRLFDIDTTSMTVSQISMLTDILTSYNDDEFNYAFSKACYSNSDISTDEKKDAYKCYVNQYKLLKKRKKSDRKNHVHENYALMINMKG